MVCEKHVYCQYETYFTYTDTSVEHIRISLGTKDVSTQATRQRLEGYHLSKRTSSRGSTFNQWPVYARGKFW